MQGRHASCQPLQLDERTKHKRPDLWEAYVRARLENPEPETKKRKKLRKN
jgi:hypothetical protein